MISTFAISDAIHDMPQRSRQELDCQLHNAAKILESEMRLLADEPITAEWMVPGSPPVAMLKLHRGSTVLAFPPLPLDRLGSAEAVGSWLKKPVWQFVTEIAKENQKRIAELARDIKNDLVIVEP